MIPELSHLLRATAYQLVLLLVLLCITLQYMGLSDVLDYQRSLIANGHWWLLLSGNFVHLGPSHLWMNLAGLSLVVMLVWQHFNALQWLILIFLCSWGVGIGLWFFNPEVEAYVGFSGTLHGLIIAGTLADLRTYPKSAALLLLLVVGKLLWEQFAGALPGSESVAGGQVLVDAHLYGAIGGAVLAPLLLLQKGQPSLTKTDELH
ncbi:MAG: rhombosortase [Granulosicoccus sp.]